jgi:dynein heavy chain
MAAMNHPGGGRNDIPHRLKRHFITFNCTIPTEEAIDHIFGTIARGHFNSDRGFSTAVSDLIGRVVPLTRQLWLATKEKMLPTPAKFHYVFNMRDLSRIWLGMIGTQAAIIDCPGAAIHLWRHEITRVIADRFVNDIDKNWFNKEMLSLIRHELGEELEQTARKVKYFVDFMQDAPEPTGEEEDEGNQETPKVSQDYSGRDRNMDYFRSMRPLTSLNLWWSA